MHTAIALLTAALAAGCTTNVTNLYALPADAGAPQDLALASDAAFRPDLATQPPDLEQGTDLVQCLPAASPDCAADADCCGGAWCHIIPGGHKACCFDTRAPCASDDQCCSALSQCFNGFCRAGIGFSCTDDFDCLPGGFCMVHQNNGAKTCCERTLDGHLLC